jgi:hypothetical protein
MAAVLGLIFLLLLSSLSYQKQGSAKANSNVSAPFPVQLFPGF